MNSIQYLKLPNGDTFIPIGLNLAFPQFYESDEEARALYRDWIGNLADNGGNFIRLWVATPFFDAEGEKCGDFRSEKTANLCTVLDYAKDCGVKVKLTLDHFRTLLRRKEAESRFTWSEGMMPELRLRFPGTWTLQSNGSGSFADNWAYQWLSELLGNDILQAHRYLDPSPKQKAVVTGPIDVNMADAVRQMEELCGRSKPVLLAEGGAVDANFAAPFSSYPQDTRGSILHDVIFAGFFAGGCGCGQAWHWDHYVAPNKLWWQFKSFSRMLEGIDPAAEEFLPHYHETDSARIYELRGRSTRLFWLRDARSDWNSELIRNLPVGTHPETAWKPPEFSGDADWACMDPWKEDPNWSAIRSDIEEVQLPEWKRSLLVRCKLTGDPGK